MPTTSGPVRYPGCLLNLRSDPTAHPQEEAARRREHQRDDSREMEEDLDREIAAEHDCEERELWRADAGPRELAEQEEEEELERQLLQDFECQLSADQTSLEKEALALDCADAKRTRGSRVSRMRAECAAWGGAAAAEQTEEEDEDEEALAFEEELANAAANAAMHSPKFGVGEMDIEAELAHELDQELDELDPTPTATDHRELASEDDDAEDHL